MGVVIIIPQHAHTHTHTHCEAGSHSVIQASMQWCNLGSLKPQCCTPSPPPTAPLLAPPPGSSDPSTPASWVARTIRACYHAWHLSSQRTMITLGVGINYCATEYNIYIININMAPIDLLHAGLPQTFTLQKMQYLQSTIKWTSIKRGMSVLILWRKGKIQKDNLF